MYYRCNMESKEFRSLPERMVWSHINTTEKTFLLEDAETEVSFLSAEEAPHIIPVLNLKAEVPNGYWQPEHRLWKAVLEDAIIKYEKLLRQQKQQKRSFDKKKKCELTELISWFFSEAHGVGSVRYICDILFLEIGPVLQYIEYIEKEMKNV